MLELVAGQETLEQSLLGPVAFAALIVPPFIDAQGRELDVAAIRSQLKKDCDALVGGDLSKQQAMLAAQAAVLNTLFMTALGHARALLLSEPETGERLARIALRAQGQAVRAVEAEAQQTPPVQWQVPQINLGEFPPTEKSGGPDHELRSITRAPAPALRNYQPSGPVAARDRPSTTRSRCSTTSWPSCRRCSRGTDRMSREPQPGRASRPASI